MLVLQKFSLLSGIIGICWLLPCGPWNDFMVISFSGWSRACKYLVEEWKIVKPLICCATTSLLHSQDGTLEFQIVHHSLSGTAVVYAMLIGQGQLYTFVVLISEVTSLEINIRWYLDTASLKRANAYLVNGVVMFFAWLVMQMETPGILFVFVPSVLVAMNLIWFGKIIKGLTKT